MHKEKAPKREHLETVHIFVVDIDGRHLKIIKYHRINRAKPETLQRLFNYLDNNFPLWRYINFYGGISRHYKCRIYNPTHPLQQRYMQKLHV
jgi:hypothetical protein